MQYLTETNIKASQSERKSLNCVLLSNLVRGAFCLFHGGSEMNKKLLKEIVDMIYERVEIYAEEIQDLTLAMRLIIKPEEEAKTSKERLISRSIGAISGSIDQLCLDVVEGNLWDAEFLLKACCMDTEDDLSNTRIDENGTIKPE